MKRRPCRDRGWSIPSRPLHHAFARSVRDINWKDRPAKHHNAATDVDRVDDHAFGKSLSHLKRRLQISLLDDG